ncbi:MAG: hypothetical protein PHW04_19070 [Candidatus Wallbacteria bacterium]|nr:hypothetical protein [Candidatus Wallbacteria bacterium]
MFDLFEMDLKTIILGSVMGLLGTGYFIYGKKAENFTALGAGVLMMAIPFFVTSFWALLLCFGLCLALPFYLKF